MSRRIEIELTSRAADGSWTWRAAGAKQPRGTLAASLVPAGAGVGSLYRAEVESSIDGLEVVAMAAVRAEAPAAPPADRIEVIGPSRREPGVSVTLLAGSKGGRDGERGRGRERDRDRDGGRGRDGDRGRRREHERSGAGGPARRPGPGGGPARGRRDDRGRDTRDAPAARRRTPPTSTVHRNALLATLRPEQLPVAEQLLRGGIPAVRRAIDEQNAAARASGGPPVSADALLAMAEELLPLTKLAEWKDRAAPGLAAGKDLRLGDLRALVTSSRSVTLDDEGRAMAKALSESLDARVTALREDWEKRLRTALAEGRVRDALAVSASPPEAGTRCPADLAVALADAAGAAMTAETDPLEWQDLLEAVTDSPVRRTVKPAGIPDDETAQTAARHAAGVVPALAKLLGLRIPPPPPRRTVVRRTLTPAGRDVNPGADA